MAAILGADWTSTTTYSGASAQKLTVDHGVVDERGRLVGGFAFIYAASSEAATKPWYGYVQATRDGKHYGASQSGAYYETLTEARSTCERKLQEQRRSYQRKYRGNELCEGPEQPATMRPPRRFKVMYQSGGMWHQKYASADGVQGALMDARELDPNAYAVQTS